MDPTSSSSSIQRLRPVSEDRSYTSSVMTNNNNHQYSRNKMRESPNISVQLEEDIGSSSSCSSSGFGASGLSLTSASSSSAGRASASKESFKENSSIFYHQEAAKQYATVNNTKNNALDCTILQAASWNSQDEQQQQQQLSLCTTINGIRLIHSQQQQVPQATRHQSLEEEFPDYKQLLVGPDQAYPSRRNGRQVVVGNYGYASTLSAWHNFNEINDQQQQNRALTQQHPKRPQMYTNSESELANHCGLPSDFINSTKHHYRQHSTMYANLPFCEKLSQQQQYQPAPVGYATVRCKSATRGRVGAIAAAIASHLSPPTPPPKNANNNHNKRQDSLNSKEFTNSNQTDETSEMSGRLSASTDSSAESGGFSKLKLPVRADDWPSANADASDLHPASSLPAAAAITSSSQARTTGELDSRQRPARKSSLLKRFGSIVSKALATNDTNCNNNAPAATHYQAQRMATTPLSIALTKAMAARESDSSSMKQTAPNTCPIMHDHHHHHHHQQQTQKVPASAIGRAQHETLHAGDEVTLASPKPDEANKTNSMTQISPELSSNEQPQQAEQQVGPRTPPNETRRHEEMRLFGAADLVILPTKHQKSCRLIRHSLECAKQATRTSHESSTRDRAKCDSASYSRLQTHRPPGLRVSASSSSGSIYSSPDSSHLTGRTASKMTDSPKPASGRRHWRRQQHRACHRNRSLAAPTTKKVARRRASSLSEELESLMSRSEASSGANNSNGHDQKSGCTAAPDQHQHHPGDVMRGRRAEKQAAITTLKSIDGHCPPDGYKKHQATGRSKIDCLVSPVLISAAKLASARNASNGETSSSAAGVDGGDCQSLRAGQSLNGGKSRSLLRWFNAQASNAATAEACKRQWQQNACQNADLRPGASRIVGESKEEKSLHCEVIKEKHSRRCSRGKGDENEGDTAAQASGGQSLVPLEKQQPASEAWGFSSLIGAGHANLGADSRSACLDDCKKKLAAEQCTKSRVILANSGALKKSLSIRTVSHQDPPDSMIYAQIKHRPKLSKKSSPKVCRSTADVDADSINSSSSSACSSDSDDPRSDEDEGHSNNGSKSFQSLNLYQNILRNYVKRRRRHESHHSHSHHRRDDQTLDDNHHRHHRKSCSKQHRDSQDKSRGHHQHHSHHNHSHNHHHHHHSHRCHHHRKGQTSSRHAQQANPANRRGQTSPASSLSQPCLGCASHHAERHATAATTTTKTDAKHTSVWGQLIKINKSDGSQVIELERAHGKSWGFFVARGAINNSRGIFISRMHDTATSHSLSGLLSIGDRILSIDDSTIEPDYDILRVNQMISKKTKITLRVKPYRIDAKSQSMLGHHQNNQTMIGDHLSAHSEPKHFPLFATWLR